MNRLWKFNCLCGVFIIFLCLGLISGIVFYFTAKAETISTSVTITVEPSCGDGTCNGTETCTSCPDDCGACSPSSGGGGGGGGGSITIPLSTNTRVVLQGKASPAAYLTVLKDGQVIANTQANSHADFKIEVANLVAGIYTFGIWGEDNSGTRSITFSFTVNVASGTTTTVSGIFLPPTIALSNDSVKKGETIGILGQTVPQAQVEIHVSSTNIIEKVVASNLGTWFYNLDTSRLEEGVHSARAKVSTDDGLLSTFSQTKLFGVGVPISAETAIQTSDLNSDQKINLIDFSIILYNWGTPKNSAADLNNDGKVNLIDFSIMLYWWTG